MFRVALLIGMGSLLLGLLTFPSRGDDKTADTRKAEKKEGGESTESVTKRVKKLQFTEISFLMTHAVEDVTTTGPELGIRWEKSLLDSKGAWVAFVRRYRVVPGSNDRYGGLRKREETYAKISREKAGELSTKMIRLFRWPYPKIEGGLPILMIQVDVIGGGDGIPWRAAARLPTRTKTKRMKEMEELEKTIRTLATKPKARKKK